MIKIENVEKQAFVKIIVEGEVWKKLDKKLYSKHLRKIRTCTDKKSLTDLFSVLEEQVALGYVYKLLAMKGYLENQLRKKLKERHFEEKAIEAVLGVCREKGYVNDVREAKGFVEREKRRGQGPRAIVQRLKEKAGVSLEVSFSQEEEREKLEQLLEKRFPDLSEIKTKERAYRFFQRRGFSEHLIREILFAESEPHYW